MPKIVVIGGSAGAINTLKLILPTLPQDFPAAVLIVTHIGSQRSMLPEILGRYSEMPVRHATDGEPIIPGRVLLAPSDHHLTVVRIGDQAYTRVAHGPRENHCRPAVDPLFRSAAAAFGTNTIGLVLSGYLDDGTVGLQAIKACGGIALVQDPSEAEASDMPASALKYAEIDRVLRVTEIGAALLELAGARLQPGAEHQQDATSGPPEWIDIENRMCVRDSDMDDVEKIGTPSSLTCPECNGALWEIHRKVPTRYRCHTGHAFTARVLEALQANAVEDAIWGAVRALHEQERLFGKLSEKELQSGHREEAMEHQAKATRARAHSQALRELIAKRAPIGLDETS